MTGLQGEARPVPDGPMKRTIFDQVIEPVRIVWALLQLGAGVGRLGWRGYVYSALKPLALLLGLWIAYTALRRMQPGGMSLPLFLATGIGIWHMFVSVQRSVRLLPSWMVNLTNIPRISMMHVRTAAATVAAGQSSSALLLFVVGIALAGIPVHIPDVLIVLVVFAEVLLFGFGFGLFAGCVRTLWRGSELVMEMVLRVIFLTSGIFFSLQDLPRPVVEWIWYNPLVHWIEYLRNAFDPLFPVDQVTLAYPALAGLIFLSIGLALDAWLRFLKHR